MFSFIKKIFSHRAATEPFVKSSTTSIQSDAHHDQASEAKRHRDRGNACLAEGKLDDAMTCYARAISLNKADVEGYINIAYVLGEKRRYAEADHHLHKAIELDPENIDVLFMLGTSARKQSNRNDANKYLSKTLSLKPNFEISYRCLLGLDKYDEAALLCDELIAVDATHVEAYMNRGHAFKGACRYDEAIQSFAMAAKLSPSHADARFNESLCRLKTGDYETGLPLYEWRWQNEQLAFSKHSFLQPLWLGKNSLAGKTILLHSEQGLGDTIQFSRYAEMVENLGAVVFLLVPKALLSLIPGLKGVSRIYTAVQDLPSFDYHCPLLSLPLAFNTTLRTIPGAVPYFYALPDLVVSLHDVLSSDSTLKVGLCWKGGSAYPADAERSPGIEPFEKLISRFHSNKVKFYTLLPDSRRTFCRIGGEDLGHELDQNTAPFVETAALIMNLDLIISCDTSIGHLAGALGKTVWLVLPFSSDWRWIGDRNDSPWYPHTRLFHQTSPGDWDELFDRVIMGLNNVLNGETLRNSLRPSDPLLPIDVHSVSEN